MIRCDVLVVGAGPAGSAAAATLAAGGCRVLLVEKDRFPRDKVCGEFLAGGALLSLDRLGALTAVEAAGPERIGEGSVSPARGGDVPFRLPSPAFGLSRRALDALLAEHAGRAGAEVRFGVRALSIAGGAEAGFEARLGTEGGSEEVAARAVVGAWGRWDALDRSLDRGFLRRPRYFGWSRDYGGATGFLAGKVRLYLFPGGYCGLSRVERGEVNLAGVISESARRAIGGGWEAVVEHARLGNRQLDLDLSRLEPGPRGFLGTVPVVFTAKPPVERGMLMAGDAAGVLDPFSGEGQSSALASGILAGDIILAYLGGGLTAAAHPRAYETAWRERFAKRFAWSAMLRTLILDPRLSRIAARLAGERLVRFAIGRLSGG
ncbi:MAG: FAD-dependent monooxygenase [Acidobacteriota bacterium]